MRSSALALKGLELEEMLRQSSLSVEGVWEWPEPKVVEASESLIDRVKHQFFPLIGNTTNLALIIKYELYLCSAP